MDNNEEYILRVLHRTNTGLQDSLIPAHGMKLKRLVDKFDQSASLADEIRQLMTVQGFSKCALVMEWLMERTKRTEEEFSPEQFESDVLLLNEKIFEAFLNQPFDMPDFGKTAEVTAAAPAVHQGFQISSDEFIAAGAAADNPGAAEYETSSVLSEPRWDAGTPESGSPGSALPSSGGEPIAVPGMTPALRDVASPELLEIILRVAQNAVEFGDKTMNERPVAASVMRVNARAGIESAKSSNNIVVEEFFAAVVKLVSVADERGKIKNDTFSDIVRDVGDRLTGALQQPDNGVALLKHITSFISDPKELLGKK